MGQQEIFPNLDFLVPDHPPKADEGIGHWALRGNVAVGPVVAVDEVGVDIVRVRIVVDHRQHNAAAIKKKKKGLKIKCLKKIVEKSLLFFPFFPFILIFFFSLCGWVSLLFLPFHPSF
jgi:hypothetical protein